VLLLESEHWEPGPENKPIPEVDVKFQQICPWPISSARPPRTDHPHRSFPGDPMNLPPRRIPRIDLLARIADHVGANSLDGPHSLPAEVPASFNDRAAYFGIRGDDVFTLFANPERTGRFEAEVIRQWIATHDPAIPGNVLTWEQFLESDGQLRLGVARREGGWAVAFDHAYVTDADYARQFWAVSGHGASEDAAILDYRRAITGRTIAINRHPELPIASAPSKQLIEVPLWPDILRDSD
jgi:hypothetical protein